MDQISVKEFLNIVEKDMDQWLNWMGQISITQIEIMHKWPFLDSLLMMVSLIVVIEILSLTLSTNMSDVSLKIKKIKLLLFLTWPKIILFWDQVLFLQIIHKNMEKQVQTNLLLRTCQILLNKTLLEGTKMKTNFRRLNGYLSKNKIKNRKILTIKDK